MATTLVLLPGKSHGGRSLVGYSPWGRKESDMTEWLFHYHFFKLNVLPVLSHLIIIDIPILQMRKEIFYDQKNV